MLPRHKLLGSLILAFSTAASQSAQAETKSYHIDIVNQDIAFDGIATPARLFSGRLPAPIIRTAEGDILKATFCNKMEEPTSVHWHGVRLPNAQDGVPVMTTPAIEAGECFTYQFPVVQSGTYWYHAHSLGHEQQGMVGALIFDPKGTDPLAADHEYAVVLSDWTHESPSEVRHNLNREDTYYAACKDKVPSWDKTLESGYDAVKQRVKDSINRMGPMDVTDVCYSGKGDAFLANGQRQLRLDSAAKPMLEHETARVRLVNAGASSTFTVTSDCGMVSIAAKDGMTTEQKMIDSLTVYPAETYDLLVMKHTDKTCAVRADSIDGTGGAVALLGGDIAPPPPDKTADKPAMVMMHHDGMDMLMPVSTGGILKSPIDTTLPHDAPWQEMTLHLTGQMKDYAYVWSFDNKTFSEAEVIDITKGTNVRLTLINDSMMDHPIHLHGFFFRAVNENGAYSPLMNVLNVPMGQSRVIEFNADTAGNWMLHCHILPHMEAGMMRTVRVSDPTAPSHDEHKSHGAKNHDMHDEWFSYGSAGLHSNKIEGDWTITDARNAFTIEARAGNEKQRIEMSYERRLSPYFGLFAGVEIEREKENNIFEINPPVGMLGVRYTLPLLIESEAAVRSDGGWEARLSNEHQLTTHISFDWAFKLEQEGDKPLGKYYKAGIDYHFNKQASCGVNTDTEVSRDFVGIGCQLKF